MNRILLPLAFVVLSGSGGLGCLAHVGSEAGLRSEAQPGPTGNRRVVVADGWIAMHTFFEVDLRVEPGRVSDAREWIDWARLEILRLEQLFSRHDPDSALSRLNRRLASGSVGGSRPESPIRVPPELGFLIAKSVGICERSEGRFDLTALPLIKFWQSQRRSPNALAMNELQHLRSRGGCQAIRTSSDHGEVLLREPTRTLDLDAISKGAVLDQLGAVFREDFPDAAALLTFGPSSVLAIGDPDGSGWRLALRSSVFPGRVLSTLVLRDRALSISASIKPGAAPGSPSHIIDPRSGRLIRGSSEVMVIGRYAADADAWSTALLVFGGEPGWPRALEAEGLEGAIFSENGSREETAGFETWRLPDEAPGRTH